MKNDKGSKMFEYSDDSVNKAKFNIQYMDADFGGTDIYRPVEDAFKKTRFDEGEKSRIFLLTDGQVHNKE